MVFVVLLIQHQKIKNSFINNGQVVRIKYRQAVSSSSSAYKDKATMRTDLTEDQQAELEDVQLGMRDFTK